MLDRLRGTYSGPPSMTSVVATLVVLGILVRITAMFTSLNVPGQTPIMLCGCGYWAQFTDPAMLLPIGMVIAMLVAFVIIDGTLGLRRRA